MIDWRPLEGFGYRSATQNIATPYGQTSNFASSYNNGVTRTRFQVSSSLPGSGPFQTSQKVKEFASLPGDEFGAYLTALGKANVLDLPYRGLGEFLLNPSRFAYESNYLDAIGRYFTTPSQFTFQRPYAGF